MIRMKTVIRKKSIDVDRIAGIFRSGTLKDKAEVRKALDQKNVSPNVRKALGLLSKGVGTGDLADTIRIALAKPNIQWDSVEGLVGMGIKPVVIVHVLKINTRYETPHF